MMNTSKLLVALFAAAGLCIAGGVSAQTQTMSKEARDAAIKHAEAQYKLDKAACDALSGNAKDVCVEEAKGKEKVAKAEADAAFENTSKAREKARTARADSAYEVAKEKCDDLAGNPKDVCLKEAQAAHVKATADAKVDRVASDARQDQVEKTTAAQARGRRGQARRRLQSGDREVRRAGRRRQGWVRPRCQGALRQVVARASARKSPSPLPGRFPGLRSGAEVRSADADLTSFSASATT